MNAWKIVALALVCSFSIQQTALASGPLYSDAVQAQKSNSQASQEEQFHQRRQNFKSGRQMLLDKSVPFEPEELLHDDWPKRLEHAFDGMPEMSETRYETAPLRGAYLADTLYLPEKIKLTGHTIILARNLVFEGKNPVIKGPYDLHIFPTQPIGVLGTTLSEALRKKARVLNVRFGSKPTLPSFSLIRDLNQTENRVTFDISGPEPQEARGEDGGDGMNGVNGGNGEPGLQGDPAGDQMNHFVVDGDLRQYTYRASGGMGGRGGTGGTGGNGGRGQDGGDGAACGCDLGDGADGGKGGKAGTGGKGGDGGPGGPGGKGGTVIVSIPWNHPGVITYTNGGPGGAGGHAGINGSRGVPGAGGKGGIGASASIYPGRGADGVTLGPGASGGSLGVGNPGPNGTQSGPDGKATITRRDQPPSGGGGVSTDPCLGGQGPDGGTPFSRGGVTPDPTCSPIIIDTEGESFHLTSAGAGVMFDIAGDGHPVHIAWTAGGFGNAFLALPGADGLVHNGKQLFGNFTPQPSSNSPNGFLALAEFDKPENGGNGDGVIDEHDAVYSHLRLWIDANHDGISQPNELHPLPELGVLSLSLNYYQARREDQFGNQFRYKAKVNPGRHDRRDESSEVGRWVYDVFLTATKK